jgi:hypothetical protein
LVLISLFWITTFNLLPYFISNTLAWLFFLLNLFTLFHIHLPWCLWTEADHWAITLLSSFFRLFTWIIIHFNIYLPLYLIFTGIIQIGRFLISIFFFFYNVKLLFRRKIVIKIICFICIWKDGRTTQFLNHFFMNWKFFNDMG